MSRANPGRVAALRALMGVDQGEHVEDILSEHAPAKGPDRGLAWHLALGTLRWQGALDHAIAPFCRRPISRLDSGVRAALRMGLFEAQKSRTPSHAAVHQAVEAVRAVGLNRATGMVNAVLRKASAVPLSEDPHHVLPEWLADRWSAHGDWLARMREPVSTTIAGQLPEGLDLRPASLNGQILDSLWTLPPGAGSISELPGFSEGLFWVMDPAAAKVADMVIAALDGNGSVLDACAAPGGKSCRLARAGLDVTAIDRDPQRLDQMGENLHRLNLDVPMQVHDWVSGPMDIATRFDAVLVDAPCTGLGTVRRHPEIIWRRQPGDMAAMAISQRVILRNASTHVKPGGALVYAVCSTEKEEGGDVAASMTGWQVETSWASAPPAGDEDGFQAFVLRRESD